jgi:hypothetical protein
MTLRIIASLEGNIVETAQRPERGGGCPARLVTTRHVPSKMSVCISPGRKSSIPVSLLAAGKQSEGELSS